jgi:butyryl-CoA dehydrogenase
MPLALAELTELLSRSADRADEDIDWPTDSWNTLMAAGAGRWSIPRAFGGDDRSQAEQLSYSEDISAACLTTAFIFSQREAAIRHLLRGPEHLKDQYLPDLADGRSFITIGLSQLTTSRQHTAPSLRASRISEDRFLLDGEIPWVTGATQAAAVVIGATLDSNEQALFLLPTKTPGVSVGPPLHLAALSGSQTCSIHCARVEATREMLLAGPKELVLGGGGGGGLETSCLAIGLSRAAISYLRDESTSRSELVPIVEMLTLEQTRLRMQMFESAHHPLPDEILSLRTKCTLLALRSTQAAQLFAKGKGFVKPHPVQRLARQALFFLVWSCPRSVTEHVANGLMSTQ